MTSPAPAASGAPSGAPAAAGGAGGGVSVGGPVLQLDAWLARNGAWLDGVLAAAAFLLLGSLSVLTGTGSTGSSVARLTTWAASIGMPIAIACRRRWPVGSAVAVNALALLHFLAGTGLLPIDLLIYVSVYSTTVHAPIWARRVSLGSAVLGSALIAASMTSGVGLDGWLSASFLFVAAAVPALLAWVAGLLRRSSSQRWESLRERAARLEYERDQQARLAVAAERTRIAREMHDVVAHSLAVVVAQADGGRYAARSDPALAAQALDTIATTARAALADTRRILGVLREDGSVPHRPQEGLADLPDLVARVRASGPAVELVTWGEPRDLPAATDLAAFRICQEALTNVLKHAGEPGTVHARVDVAWHPTALVLQVDDDGRGAAAAPDGAGNGLTGMRERAALFGGALHAGPRPGGGFRVHATFPLPPSPIPQESAR
ncbi:sensor histidine kinase [Miniimonas arenae]|uniref:sensor histidine kinase n=1 Tax=Miniimonas arenae TaxID=676201 RepID=UPI0028A90ECA|nr:histidine kinase [Miniimonas arenae]